MHGLFFEVRPLPGHLDHYFDHVARLRPVLARHTGLAFLDRYTALADPEVLLSHQLWESEAAIAGWRQDAEHRRSQTAGRRVHFADYRIRVGARVLHWQAGAPELVGTGAGGDMAAGRHLLALYGRRPVTDDGFVAFESVNREGVYVALASLAGHAEAEAALRAQIGRDGVDEAAAYAIRRDYGMVERAEAPG